MMDLGAVVPAKAGTHTPRTLDRSVAMGPGSPSLRLVAWDDSGERAEGPA